ncbi:MAG: pyridoxamine 5'-phosphate oxidase [Burkholderiales bacterium]
MTAPPVPPAIAALRKDYALASLDEGAVSADPVVQFSRWLEEAIAAGCPEPTAMSVATVSDAGRPSSRILLLKEISGGALVFYTNYDSRKGRELASNPHAALLFHWVELEREVRIEGRVEKGDPAAADAYFNSRPLLSRIGAIASPQSDPIESRAWLEERFAAAQAEHGQAPVRPPHWGGYRLLPDSFEFWQGRRSRLHDRIAYTCSSGNWQRARLAP